MNILLLMTGSIACAKASGLISLWKKNGHDVKVVASNSALEFVGIATLEGLSGNPVMTSVFETNNMMDHINVSRQTDIIVLAPATANTINKLANGTADDVITTTWIAAQELYKPMYIAPAMNTKMWEYPATQKSLSLLNEWGITILSPQDGDLACGETGSGRMMEIEDINKAIMVKSDKHIIVTAGGTREYIDGVRYIGNLSTGKTGAHIADFYTSHGYNVTWLGAINSVQPKLLCKKVFYETFSELSDQLKSQLKKQKYDIIIHAAAISDFKVQSVIINDNEITTNRDSKLPSSNNMTVNLSKNPKLVQKIRGWSLNKKLKVIAFKLTNTDDSLVRKSAILKLLNQDDIDYVAHNDLSEISDIKHSFNFYQSNDTMIPCHTTKDLCLAILEKAL